MSNPDYNLPTPPAIRALAAMLLMVALWVAVFVAVLLLSAPARADEPLLKLDPQPYTMKRTMPEHRTKAGDPAVTAKFRFAPTADPYLAVIHVELAPQWRGWTVDVFHHDKAWFRKDVRAVQAMPGESDVELLFHGGPDRDGFIKAIKEGKAVKLWQR